MIFEKANKQASFNNTLINQIRAASHWLTYLISPRQPWGNLQTAVILYKLFISYDTSKNFPHFWPSLPEGLGCQKLVSVHSLLFHTCVNSGSQILHITPVPLDFSWECQTVVKHTRFKMSCVTHQHGYGSLTKTKNEAKTKPKPINSYKFKWCVEVQGTKLRR